jgi:hypothetical protein
MESNTEVPQKLKIKLPHNSAIPPLGMYPKECTPGYGRAICTLMFIVALFIIAKFWKQPK